MLTLTDLAVEKVNELIKSEKAEGKALRVFVEAGGCSGFSYGFTFDDKSADDQVVTYDGFELVVDPNSLSYLDGAKVDYVDGLHGAGFKIENPNAKGSCGCGSSFNV
ncbi:MAG: iron-sulfur cluster insertion protein ErpA [Planctomycetes bacterium]|nr:iron-sulfur cluster insertion protein ErpA [Planctomycetota bacterium]MBI3845351.1 iron-sulfur cluster insertion protein ErpA [Planctomycetota bacterium]